ncbi:MAG: anthranilate synthase component I family protein [Bacteroidales bacterium]|nr:anthranilate synthase component I family protein [Bacteroidales bacterium]
MQTFKFNTYSIRLLSDFHTPVSLYLKIRDLYPESALLESTEYRTPESSYSFIGFCPLAHFEVKNEEIEIKSPDNTISNIKIDIENKNFISEKFNDFCSMFDVTSKNQGEDEICRISNQNPTGINGVFGFTSYDAVSFIEPVKFHPSQEAFKTVPFMKYIYYRYLIVMNMFKNEMYIVENLPEGEELTIDNVVKNIENNNFDVFGFSATGEIRSNLTDKEHIDIIEKGIAHCKRGDVFQVVLGRQFSQHFLGDDFNVYRALRSINPSPYLFYFDFGSYKIFGSSPETHFRIKGDEAYIDPIAGTFKRSGDEKQDALISEALLKDPKENAEHVMLVDLARNDLSRHAENVHVKKFKELQYYSHVIHIVSRVTGELKTKDNPMQIFLDTFPAGTLSGAPKVRALQIIGELEPQARGFYGGCIGYIGFDGDVNQAITIRSFLSKENTLFFQAGGGIVAKSDPENELQEVHNKLGALRKAIILADDCSKANNLSFVK